MRQIHWKIREQVMLDALKDIAGLETSSSSYANLIYASQRARSALLACEGYALSTTGDLHADIVSGKHLEILTLGGEAVSAIEHLEGRLYRLLLANGGKISHDAAAPLYARPVESPRDADSSGDASATPEAQATAPSTL